jgi:hypothetical protein
VITSWGSEANAALRCAAEAVSQGWSGLRSLPKADIAIRKNEPFGSRRTHSPY